jgi:hypothetical protein
MAKHRSGRPATQNLHVVDAISACRHGVHERQQLGGGAKRRGAAIQLELQMAGQQRIDRQPPSLDRASDRAGDSAGRPVAT